MTTPRVYTVPEVAQVLRIGRGAAYALVNSGQLRAIRVGNRTIRVPADAVDDFLTNGSADYSRQILEDEVAE